MQSYRFSRFGSLDHLRMHDEALPSPGRGEVLVKVHASSLNYRDLALLHGRYPMSWSDGLVPLSDGAGEIVALGEGCRRFAVGDRVCNNFFPEWFGGPFPLEQGARQYGSNLDGWLCQYKIVGEETLARIPDHLSFVEAAALPCAALTAWTALTGPAPIRAGDTVLTQGTGGVSLFAVQLAKLMGARVIATTSSADKAEKLKALGADEVIDYRAAQNWGERARALSGGQGVDRIIEVGGQGTLEQSLAAIAAGGEIAVIGFLDQGGAALDFMHYFKSGATLRRIAVGHREGLEAMLRAIGQHGLRPVVDQAFSFGDARAAFEHFEARRHFGKVVIQH
ncbi:NAD(P)-dependent alcohol dehydrogenase [Chromobacterium sp. IIBBL 290-4]|uniref:zinc-dependent alcohol dehydrogenase family protein n=1 Tax=Chromobacterium sp. IIBBL 290-4 TaxID=2953890 RepID=UPI0020B7BF60|nr:NAD(P)-dependent alcohol dehydrogenase [Chromobacterium sp. IIBBL 290-4]UTH75706.1 NAD(P)-dependent alcohol dehydrogenase [Chromobacterium sp. IIBBL 290-4]